jgi:guanylate kinase
MSLAIKTKNIFIISGPSGAGEDSVIDGLTKILPIERVITTTSRAPRSGEEDGNPYYFISREEFEEKIEAGEFLEYAQEYNQQFYGVTKKELHRIGESQKIGLWKIEYQGVITAKKLFPAIIAILLTAPLSIMEARIRRRGNLSPEDIAERMAYTKEWLSQHTDIYDYTVENQEGKLEETIANFKKIIEQELQAK